MYELYFVFVVANVVLIGVNLLPIPPLDGANAWRLVPILYRELRARVDAQARVAQARPEQRQRPQRSKMQKPEQKLHVLADYRDEGVLDEENERRIRELIDKTVKK
jgi:membrane-associated protease RseP (regulator of RpoE activity)